MVITHVHVHVMPDRIEEFKKATLENAENSLKEPGVARFDFLQQKDDPARFVLVEIYRAAADPGRHKETAHYLKWRDAVAGMMAEPRRGVSYEALSPL
jgi:autoinducer 2-degrading protein